MSLMKDPKDDAEDTRFSEFHQLLMGALDIPSTPVAQLDSLDTFSDGNVAFDKPLDFSPLASSDVRVPLGNKAQVKHEDPFC
ncbi:Hypothetical predicted protein [Olea europaea subsp. europaea]|uniref:Uncharacterized protein n=1 Tax=Olea europaea subsp. europaea TaxID=158383 RepID=A0A8S0T768_OLEEU|nr:Hypothetical predicted protein [Olea europaea subsp. europaea]